MKTINVQPDLIREINNYFGINNTNVKAMNDSLRNANQAIADLTKAVIDLKTRVDMMESKDKTTRIVN